MTTYTWNFPALDAHTEYTDAQSPANTESNVVHTVHWRLTASKTVGDEEYTVDAIGTEAINIDDLSDFTPADQLSQVMVEAWVEEAMGEERLETLKASLSESLEEQITPSTVTLTLPEQGA